MKKQIYTLGLVFCALCIFVAIYFLVQKDNTPQRLISYTPDQVKAFQINNFTMGVLFKKEDTHWLVRRVHNELTQKLEKTKGMKIAVQDKAFIIADPVAITESLTYLLTLNRPHPVSQGNTNATTFEINDYSLHVILYGVDNQELDRIYIGKNGPDLFSSFIKKASQPDIYLAPINFRQLFLRPFDDWLLKQDKDNDKKKHAEQKT